MSNFKRYVKIIFTFVFDEKFYPNQSNYTALVDFINSPQKEFTSSYNHYSSLRNMVNL
jgi:hypothetical protein